MGGFGALDIARLNPKAFCAVGGHSAALWRSGGETPAGAFDDADDFDAHDVIGATRSDSGAFDDVGVWLDTGDSDPFESANSDFADALRDGGVNVTTHTWPGGHTGSYWRRHFGAYMRFYADALKRCG